MPKGGAPEDSLHVVESAQSAAEPYLARLSGPGSSFRGPASCRATHRDGVSLSLDAEARTSEEPGAGNPHAGICEGAVG